MEKHYRHLSTTDRVTLMFLKRQGLSLRAIASELNRSPSILSWELQRRRLKADPTMPKQQDSQRVQRVCYAGPGDLLR
jgi:IS30 family transposase